MTNETRSPKEIESEIEAQRSDLTSNLQDLQDKFSIDTIVRQIGDQFREHGGDMGRSISDQVKANPIPLALTGIGLAWMMFGNAQKTRVPARIADQRDDDRYSDVEQDFRRTRLEHGRPYTQPTDYAPEHEGPSWSRGNDDDSSTSMGDRVSSGAASVKDRASKVAGSFNDGTSAAADAFSDGASSAGKAVGNAAGSAKTAVSNGAQSVKSSITSGGNRIAEGTETLTEEGRQRVIAARRKAIEMRQSASRSVNDGADAAADFYDRQPLVVGALALAVGAAFGGALPRTKTEDDLVGVQSDTLFSEAERIFEEEKAKALSVAKSVKDEVKDIASETKADLDEGAPGDKSAVEAIGDRAKAMTGRVADTAKSTAKDEKLGKPKA